jgi:excisionase family DNA binding protein
MSRISDGGKRSRHAANPQRRPLAFDESFAEQLQRTNTALERLLQQREANAERGQPDQARGPPDSDISLRVYSVREVAKILRISISSAYAAIANGQIPSVRIGGRLLISHAILVRMLEGESTGATVVMTTSQRWSDLNE